jgi:RelE toxin of RelE / RelB toxin-antitoxin system
LSATLRGLAFQRTSNERSSTPLLQTPCKATKSEVLEAFGRFVLPVVGKGKSGGYRVITAYFGTNVPVYLVALLSKGERSNFSAAEVAAFKKLTGEISRYWRGSRR